MNWLIPNDQTAWNEFKKLKALERKRKNKLKALAKASKKRNRA